MRVRDVRVVFEKRDAWIGVYWDFDRRGRMWILKVYVCLLPFLPIVVKVTRP